MGGLGLLSPWFLAGAAAVALPVVLHLLARHTAPPVAFPAMRFVPATPVETRRRRRVTDPLLLAVRCLVLLLIALAFARPYLEGLVPASAQVRVVVLDTSFSMAAPATWAAARAAAARAIDEAPPGTAVGVLTLTTTTRVLVPLTLDRAAARARLDEVSPGFASARYDALGAGVAELLAGRRGEVVLVTDLQRAGLGEAIRWLPDVALSVVSVPLAQANLSVSSIERNGPAIVASVVNHGLMRRQTTVSLEIDGERVASRTVDLEAGLARIVEFPPGSREGGTAVVSVEDDGGLPADDRRYLILDAVPAARVWVVSHRAGAARGGFHVEQALAVAPGTRPVRVVPLTLPLERLDAALLAEPPHVVVLLATRGLGPAARGTLQQLIRNGTGLLVAAGPDIEAGSLAALLGPAGGTAVEHADAVPVPTRLVAEDVRHPVFAPFHDRPNVLGRVLFDRIVRVRTTEGDRVVARFENGLPALVERRQGGTRWLLLASDLDARWNDWPRSPTFVPVLHAAIAHLARIPPASVSLVVDRLPAVADIAPTPGVHTLPDGRRVAVNVDPRESTLDVTDVESVLAALVPDDVPRVPATALAASQEASQQGWWYLALAALVAVVGESLMVAGRGAVRP